MRLDPRGLPFVSLMGHSPCAGQAGRMLMVKIRYVEDSASHSDPESCVVAREGRGEALTGAGAGRVSSRESTCPRAQARGPSGCRGAGESPKATPATSPSETE